MEDERIPLSLRGLWIITRVLMLIAFVTCICAVWEMSSGPTVSLWWHCLHGNKVSFQGRQIAVPIMWRLYEPRGPRSIHLRPASGDSEVGIYSSEGHGIMDVASAQRWQAETASGHNSMSTLDGPYHSDTFRAKTLTFYCVDWVPDGKPYVFFCRVVDTNWEIDAAGDPGDLEKGKEILASIE